MTEDIVVAQRGAREHYLLPRVCARMGRLNKFVTDWYSFSWVENLRSRGLLPNFAHPAASNWSKEIQKNKVISFRWFGLYNRSIRRFAQNRSKYEYWNASNAAFARRAATVPVPENGIFIGYSYASLETFQVMKNKQILCITGQIDPGLREWEIVQKERSKWSDYERPEDHIPKEYYKRASSEWDLADAIIVNSNWSKKCIIEKGAEPDKCFVVPLAFERMDSGISVSNKKNSRNRKLRILWIGTVCVRKGIQYLIEVAKSMIHAEIEIRIAGQIQINKDIVKNCPSNVKWLGPVPRSDVSALYRWADIFVIPTISDGFAITQLEALSYNVPVIATKNCGEVVLNNVNGLICETSTDSLEEAISLCCKDRNLVRRLSFNCPESLKKFSLGEYSTNLLNCFQKLKP